MKKALLCALLLTLSCAVCAPVALAENACPSGCSCAQTEARISSRFALNPSDFLYTQEFVYGDFRVFFPSTFKQTGDPKLSPYRFSKEGSDEKGETMIEFIPYSQWPGDENEALFAYYGDSQEYLSEQAQLAVERGYELVAVDECVGLVDSYLLTSVNRLHLSFSNRKNILTIYISAPSAEEAYELLDGILERIVAPEQPLKEAP